MIKEFSLKTHSSINIAKNFKIKEFACKDGNDKILIDTDIIDVLQKIRDEVNMPVKVISAYRTISYNKMCGGANSSMHLFGRAVDFTFDFIKNSDTEIVNFAKMIEKKYNYIIKGIGIYINRPVNYIHIDNRTKNTYWINDKKTQVYYSTFNDYNDLNRTSLKTVVL